MMRYAPIFLLLAGSMAGADTVGDVPATLVPADSPAQVTISPVAPVTPLIPIVTEVKNSGAIDAALAEIAAWNAVKGSENTSDYQAYLKRYPEGSFAELAEFRIRELDTRKMLADSAALWLTLKNGEDLESIEAFITQYGQSPLAAEAEMKARTLRPMPLVVHYIRQDQVLIGWKLKHESSQLMVPFDRLDDVGGIAHLGVKAKLAAQPSGFSLLHGEKAETCAGQREIKWDRPTEIWLLERDCAVYGSLAAAKKALQQRIVPKGMRRLHYWRADGQESAWSFVLKNDKLLDGLFSLMSRKESMAFRQRDQWAAFADWKEQEGQAGVPLLLALHDGADHREICEKPVKWPAEKGSEAWYVSGSCTLLFDLGSALQAQKAAVDKR